MTAATSWPLSLPMAMAGEVSPSLAEGLALSLLAASLPPLLRRWSRPELQHWLGHDCPDEPRPLLLSALASLLGLGLWLVLQWTLAEQRLGLAVAAALAFCASSLTTLSRIDLQVRLLPDRLTALLAAVGLLVSALGLSIAPSDALVGGALGYGLPYAMGRLLRRTRRADPMQAGLETGIGRGDLALMAALGTWVGFEGLAWLLVVSALIMIPVLAWGMTFRGWSSRSPLPFGPALSAAGFLVLPWAWAASGSPLP